MNTIKVWMARWLEKAVLLPLMVLATLLAWVIIGALDNTATQDMLAMLMALPIRSAYVFAWLGVIWLARRRFRRRLSDEEQTALWVGVMKGERGPTLIFLIDVGIYLCLASALYPFFFLHS